MHRYVNVSNVNSKFYLLVEGFQGSVCLSLFISLVPECLDAALFGSKSLSQKLDLRSGLNSQSLE